PPQHMPLLRTSTKNEHNDSSAFCAPAGKAPMKYAYTGVKQSITRCVNAEALFWLGEERASGGPGARWTQEADLS
ncbi:MAG: hypothetical protein LC641_07310, partial [Spirochaeta sp.]|nr:hypothetical protein [Spirochaeta sp.]